jgi:hypothetical protein
VGGPALAQQVIGANGRLQVVQVDPAGHPHEHVLRALDDLAVDAQQVGALQRLWVGERGGEGVQNGEGGRGGEVS